MQLSFFIFHSTIPSNQLGMPRYFLLKQERMFDIMVKKRTSGVRRCQWIPIISSNFADAFIRMKHAPARFFPFDGPADSVAPSATAHNFRSSGPAGFRSINARHAAARPLSSQVPLWKAAARRCRSGSKPCICSRNRTALARFDCPTFSWSLTRPLGISPTRFDSPCSLLRNQSP